MTEHIFIEDIIYCPSQIYYYFRDDEGYLRVAYIRQRGGPLTFELVEIDGNTGSWIWDFSDNNKVRFSREYDINGQPDKESEEKEIIELENEVLWYLRQRYPKVKFPDQPRRHKK